MSFYLFTRIVYAFSFAFSYVPLCYCLLFSILSSFLNVVLVHARACTAKSHLLQWTQGGQHTTPLLLLYLTSRRNTQMITEYWQQIISMRWIRNPVKGGACQETNIITMALAILFLTWTWTYKKYKKTDLSSCQCCVSKTGITCHWPQEHSLSSPRIFKSYTLAPTNGIPLHWSLSMHVNIHSHCGKLQHTKNGKEKVLLQVKLAFSSF